MSLELQIKGLQFFSKHQKKGKKHEKEEKDICDIFLNFFEEKTLTFFNFRTPYFYHLKSILSD
jgi:hypothetical protein